MNIAAAEYIAEGYTLITGSQRLARHLQHQHVQRQLAAGKKVWETPKILSWHSWLVAAWDVYASRHDAAPTLLDASQSRALWQQVIDNSSYSPQLLQSAHVARQVEAAWQLLQEWQQQIFPDGLYLNEDAYAFKRWSDDFAARCRKQGWIDQYVLADQYRDRIRRDQPALDLRLALTGFDNWTPQQAALLEVLEAQGAVIQRLALPARNRSCISNGFIDSRTELVQAARWARQRLEADPTTTVGILVPNLHAVRSLIEDSFDEVLLPANGLRLQSGQQRPYSIAVGKSLGRFPVIHAALILLGLFRPHISLADMSCILRTPFVRGGVTEKSRRAVLDAELRKLAEPEVKIASVLYTGSQRMGKGQRANMLLSILNEVQKIRGEGAHRQGAGVWVKRFTALLQAFGWPGERILSSTEHQVVEAWKDLLQTFTALDLVTQSMDFPRAFGHLQRLAGEHMFQPKTPEVPIQVMGLASAADMQFDHLWVTGLHAEVWPRPARPNPFIPIKLQRDQGMPRAGAGLELEYARDLTAKLVRSASEVVFSFPQHDRDRPLRPSPLVAEFATVEEAVAVAAHDDFVSRVFETRLLEKIDDGSGPPLAAATDTRGGAGLFRDQAACPFRAFARYRLNALTVEEIDLGLDPMQRGTLVHRVMQGVWKEIKTLQRLLSLESAYIDDVIRDVIDVALARDQKRRPRTFARCFTALEKQRLHDLIRQWLEIEKTRTPFTVVAREHQHQAKIGGLSVATRIDRIDKLEDERLVVLDYKTGEVGIRQWLDDRPDDPQLPLYAVTCDGDVAALAFARIKRGDCRFEGLSDGTGILPDVPDCTDTRLITDDGWRTLFASWEQTLSALARAFANGDALVAPKTPATCNYCEQDIFCRIRERADNAGENEE